MDEETMTDMRARRHRHGSAWGKQQPVRTMGVTTEMFLANLEAGEAIAVQIHLTHLDCQRVKVLQMTTAEVAARYAAAALASK